MAKEEKNPEEKIEEAKATLKKKYGEGVLMELNKDIDFKVDWVPTGCFSLDEIIGAGIPRGRLIEVYGAESSGKSTLALFIMAQIQKRGGKVAFIDAENAFDGSYASNIGLDLSTLFLSQPESLEESMDIIKELVETGAIDVIVVDSVSALVPRTEVESEDFMKDTMAIQARLMSRALRILAGPISKSKTVVIFINQIRDKIGIFYGSKTTTSGGRALKFYCSVRLAVTKGKKIVDKDDVQIGNQMVITAMKNKVGFPMKKTTVDLYYAKGIDMISDAISFGEKIGVVTKEGITYSFGEIKLGAGRERARQTLIKDDKLFEEIKKAINDHIGLKKNGKDETKN